MNDDVKRIVMLRAWNKLPIIIFLFWSAFFVFFQTRSIYGGDSGDLVSAAITAGIPHPPGYPLYTFLGFLLTKLPLFTPAWRVGLLSSIPDAGALAILYLIIYKITKNRLASFSAICLLGFNYLFWLYSSVAEVFALNNLMAVVLIYLWLEFYCSSKSQAIKWLPPIAFITALIVSHHHTLVFIFPGFIYIVLKRWDQIMKLSLTAWLKISAFFTAGLLPLLYLPFSSSRLPQVDWGNVVSFTDFFKLITRAYYGTFLSNALIGDNPIMRITSIFAFMKFFSVDFWLVGIILAFAGLLFLWKTRQFFWFIVLELVSLLFFLFYASFILSGDFTVATFERFMLLPYIFCVILIGCGISWLSGYVKKPQFKKLFWLIVIAYPIGILASNYPKVSILKYDLTAERMAEDILHSIPKGSILLLSTDTPIFDTQYYYYAFGKTEDVKLIHIYKLDKEFYQKNLKKYYSDLNLPSKDFKGLQTIDGLIEANKDKQFFSTVDTSYLPEGSWSPWGLLLKYFESDSSTPSAQKIYEENLKLWSSYQDPLSGSLGKYKNLFLSDVARLYTQAHKSTGLFLLENGFLDNALSHFTLAKSMDNKDIRIYEGLGRVYLAKKDCTQAEKQFNEMIKINKTDPYGPAYLRKTYLECFNDPSKAKTYENSCVQIQEQKQPNLKDL